MTSETMFAQSPSIGFKWKLDVRFLKIAIKAMSDARKVSEVLTSLEIYFSTIEVGLHCSFHPENTSLYHSLLGEISYLNKG